MAETVKHLKIKIFISYVMQKPCFADDGGQIENEENLGGVIESINQLHMTENIKHLKTKSLFLIPMKISRTVKVN